MVTLLIDSDILIEYLKGRQTLLDSLTATDEVTFALSVITLAEVMEGVIDNDGEKEKLENVLQDFMIIPVDSTVARGFASIRSHLRKQGKLLENMDLFIAATALVHKLTLVTNNKKHFQRIPGLQLY